VRPLLPGVRAGPRVHQLLLSELKALERAPVFSTVAVISGQKEDLSAGLYSTEQTGTAARSKPAAEHAADRHRVTA
jgi:hypothetical protein